MQEATATNNSLQSVTKILNMGSASRAIEASEKDQPVKLPHADEVKPVKEVKKVKHAPKK